MFLLFLFYWGTKLFSPITQKYIKVIPAAVLSLRENGRKNSRFFLNLVHVKAPPTPPTMTAASSFSALFIKGESLLLDDDESSSELEDSSSSFTAATTPRTRRGALHRTHSDTVVGSSTLHISQCHISWSSSDGTTQDTSCVKVS